MITPVIKYDNFFCKRDDLFEVYGVNGAKARGIAAVIEGNKPSGIVTVGSRESAQVQIASAIASELGVRCRCHVPGGGMTKELEFAVMHGAVLVRQTPGYTSVLKVRAELEAKQSGYLYLPFGLLHPSFIEVTRKEAASTFKEIKSLILDKTIKRVLMPIGSGTTMIAVLTAIYDLGFVLPVVGVQVGASPTKAFHDFLPMFLRRTAYSIIKYPGSYAQSETQTLPDGTPLHPHYESKAYKFLQDGDLFWVAGGCLC